jgi:hypothetical protein
MTEPRNPLEVVEEALETIMKAEGPYSRDRLTHAENTITHMVMQARAALALVRKMRADAVEGWAQVDGSAWLRGDSGWKDSYAEASPSLCRAILLPLPDSTEPNDED